MKTRHQLNHPHMGSEENNMTLDVLTNAIRSAASNPYDCYPEALIYNPDTKLMSYLLSSPDLTTQIRQRTSLMFGGTKIMEDILLEPSERYCKIASLDDYLALLERTKTKSLVTKENKGLQFLNTETYGVDATSNNALFSDPAKPLVAVNKFLASIGRDPLGTNSGKQLLADIAAASTKAYYTVELIAPDTKISEVYRSERKGEFFPSCMSGKPRGYFEIYDDMQDEGILSMLRVVRHSFNDTQFVGRALLWTSSEGTRYLDRVYMHTVHDVVREDGFAAMKSALQNLGITKCVHADTAHDYGLIHRHVYLATDVANICYDHLPYADSFYILDDLGYIRTKLPSTHTRCIRMRDTHGNAAIPSVVFAGREYSEAGDCVTVAGIYIPVPKHAVTTDAAGDYIVRPEYVPYLNTSP